jgi:hypothetical protein
VFRPKLEPRRQARIYLGLDCRKVVWRRFRMASGLTLWFTSRRRSRQRELHGSGVERIFGCSCRVSVAEIGEKHLPRVIKVSRKASQGGAG